MATNNNLTDFLTAVADAIREKNGTTDAINPQDMPGTIASIGGTAVDFTTADNSDTNVSALCTSIANAIRAKKSYDSTKLINPQDFPEEIRGIVTRSYMTVTTNESSVVVYVDDSNTTLPANTETELTPTKRFASGSLYQRGGVLKWSFSSTNPNPNGIIKINCSNLDTSTFTTMQWMFRNCGRVTSLDVGRFNTSQITSMSAMFYNCSSLTSLDLSLWNISNVTIVDNMFTGCASLKSLNLSSFNTSNITSCVYIFSDCYSLANIKFGPGWGKQTSTEDNALTLNLSTCNSNNSYLLTAETYESMLTMYDRATAGLTNMTIKVKNTTNAPENWTANMQARGYTITVG